MPIQIIEFNGESYPAFQAEGNAARWIMPFALKICQPNGKGIGFDIGCNRLEWCMPKALPIDSVLGTDALNLPDWWLHDNVDTKFVDYIFSSHCLEHLPNWVTALDYWYSRLKHGGVCFLYLPANTQLYWMPFQNRKHIHSFTPELIELYFKSPRKEFEGKVLWKNVFVSGIDLNNSFCVIAEKI